MEDNYYTAVTPGPETAGSKFSFETSLFSMATMGLSAL